MSAFIRTASVGAAGALMFVAAGGVNTAYADEVSSITETASQESNTAIDTQSVQAAVAVISMQSDLVKAETPAPPAPVPADTAAAASDAAASDAASTPVATPNPTGAQAEAWAQVQARGWGADQFVCLVSLWQKESGWRVNATNSSSGAYGIPQSLPGSKMASAGADWQTNPATQIEWGLGYIAGRYSTPCGAWGHSQSVGWY
ncbi:lytic transglycosylase domain-containing protein [Pseudoclavibacter sp. CFCC 14310]|uniref:aggregation-promoting factor C-terminal-like domain-containing protein n=1 Tax=Pseudoclavibacter sp. CFCC 14310 TaxID=2615180 RepID=UPI001CE4564C|nr:lytic transglycosylase domain-containing protein [Pseudoclavibacter sp. CFCC 14310]